MEKRNSIEKMNAYIEEKQNDQDFQQKMKIIPIFFLEFYRVIIGSFLLFFVPQKCEDDLCSLFHNLGNTDPIIQAGMIMNLVNFIGFVCLYGIELKRESKLIHYLEVNRHKPVDNESVGEELLKIDEDKIMSIWNIDKLYYRCGTFLFYFYIANVILSCFGISKQYMDSSTVVALVTNVLFMSGKISDIRAIVNTPENVFYSAYIKSRTQFNDVDPDKLKSLENEKNKRNNNKNNKNNNDGFTDILENLENQVSQVSFKEEVQQHIISRDSEELLEKVEELNQEINEELNNKK